MEMKNFHRTERGAHTQNLSMYIRHCVTPPCLFRICFLLLKKGSLGRVKEKMQSFYSKYSKETKFCFSKLYLVSDRNTMSEVCAFGKNVKQLKQQEI